MMLFFKGSDSCPSCSLYKSLNANFAMQGWARFGDLISNPLETYLQLDLQYQKWHSYNDDDGEYSFVFNGQTVYYSYFREWATAHFLVDWRNGSMVEKSARWVFESPTAPSDITTSFPIPSGDATTVTPTLWEQTSTNSDGLEDYMRVTLSNPFTIEQAQAQCETLLNSHEFSELKWGEIIQIAYQTVSVSGFGLLAGTPSGLPTNPGAALGNAYVDPVITVENKGIPGSAFQTHGGRSVQLQKTMVAALGPMCLVNSIHYFDPAFNSETYSNAPDASYESDCSTTRILLPPTCDFRTPPLVADKITTPTVGSIATPTGCVALP